MRRRRIFTLGGATVALGLAGVVAGSTVTQASPQHTDRVLTLQPARVTSATVLPRTVRAPAGLPAIRTAANKCGFVNAVPYDRYKGLPPFTTASARRPFIVKMFTTQGLIVWSAFTDAAPCTTFSFRFLAQHGFYNGTHCHRLVTKGIFVLQCGDPTGTGSGAPGYKFNDENLKGATYPAGMVAMANAGPNTNGSQFFFNTEANPLLAPNYTPFGFVIQGMSVLRKIAAAGDDSQNGPGDGFPHLNVTFKKVQIVFLR
ncbi:MAG TPA: peptidylprolyl isomerase [Streptosporangiaceae bacterium]|jgi:peptidyl-prolyl cis-trans isomerase B (cyclophilin B)|nr:peptidylprolyl isomerase [Streptosporangiaceae bacterium]